MRRSRIASRLNFEIAGIAALGLALLLGIALARPEQSGNLGAATAYGLHVAFGGAAWLFPLLIALLGVIIFLEIDVPRMMATLGLASCCYFLVIDTAFGPGGGAVGATLRAWLETLVGRTGAAVTVIVAAIVVTIWITNVSVKRVIGWCILQYARARDAFRALRSNEHDDEEDEIPAAVAPGPKSLREAFHLPASTKTTLATIAPVGVKSFIASSAVAEPKQAPRPLVPRVPAIVDDETGEEEFEDEVDEDDDADVDEEDDVELDEADDEDEEDDDEDEDEEDEEDEDEDEDEERDRLVAPAASKGAIVGEYESAAVAGVAQARTYRLPDLALFDPPQMQLVDESSRTHVLEDTLASFGVVAKVVHIERGPSITRYELKPDRGVKISRISSLADDIALALAATSVRIEAPIPGKSAVGIEVPNAQVSIVAISEILSALPQRGTI
ncbi:MAG TPA: DNA translocase FtsK 4TM domain-containing protein, partial [Candidatus Baltobacteraceae bacterium]